MPCLFSYLPSLRCSPRRQSATIGLVLSTSPCLRLSTSFTQALTFPSFAPPPPPPLLLFPLPSFPPPSSLRLPLSSLWGLFAFLPGGAEVSVIQVSIRTRPTRPPCPHPLPGKMAASSSLAGHRTPLVERAASRGSRDLT